MTVVIVSDFSLKSTGGVQSSILSQIHELRRQGHRVIVVSPTDGDRARGDSDSIMVPSFRFIRPNDHATPSPLRYSVRGIVQQLANEGADIVHSQTTGILGAHSRSIADGLGVPLVQTMHGRDDMFIAKTSRRPLLAAVGVWLLNLMMVRTIAWQLPQESSLVGRLLWSTMLSRANRADFVTVPSRHFRQKFIDRGIPEHKITVVSNGIDDAVYSQLSDVASSTRLGISRLLWCGRLSAEKDPLIAIEAVAALPYVSLSIYGEGPMRARCQALIGSLGLESRVLLHGSYKHNDVYSLMANHDLLLYTSYDFDNQPMVLLEAAAAGLPVVFSDPDMMECVASNGGVRTKDHTSMDYAEAIRSINKDSLSAMQASQRDFAKLHLQSATTRAMVDAYNTAIEVLRRAL